MFMVRRGERAGRWLAALRCPDAAAAEAVFVRWCERYVDEVVELLHDQHVIRQRFPTRLVPADGGDGAQIITGAGGHPAPQ